MQNNKKNTIILRNLLGDEAHRNFLELQTNFGFEKRGGSFLTGLTEKHASRLVHDLNLLSADETREFIYSLHFTTLS
jgi:hypothetical protein